MGRTGVNHDWTAAEDALLGTKPDGEVAQRIGLTPLAVFKSRKKLGIPAYNKPVNRHTPYPAEIAGNKRIGKMKVGRVYGGGKPDASGAWRTKAIAAEETDGDAAGDDPA